jgi:Putative Ig domain
MRGTPWLRLQFVLFSVLFLIGTLSPAGWAQQGAATGEPLAVKTINLPKVYVREPYSFQLRAEGGILPLKWQVTGGDLPPGIGIDGDGVLSGTATKAGDFPFTVTVTDSGKPSYELHQDLTLHVLAPLVAEWSHYPKINGRRVEGSLKVTNQTDDDFDLTMIALAVNEIGRAIAVGYQHFKLKKGTADMEIPLGENLPRGAYDLNVDVVAEVPETGNIHRVHLVTNGKLQVQQGP